MLLSLLSWLPLLEGEWSLPSTSLGLQPFGTLWQC